MYVLKVNPIYRAKYPTTNGPRLNPEKTKVDKLETVNEIVSFEIIKY
tara:strand:+ start:555 stop:695 length:141 start_codon:yes stop_codon:yes gene_type:complete